MFRSIPAVLVLMLPGLWLIGCATKAPTTTEMKVIDDRAETGKADVGRQIVFKVQGLT